MEGMLDNLMKNHQNSLKSLFLRKRSTKDDGLDSSANSPTPIPQLSPLANSVVARCSKILGAPTEELQHRFDIELPESVKQLFTYARNFVEFCSYQTLHAITRRSDFLSDKDFRRLTYDMMLAWEIPSVENVIESPLKGSATATATATASFSNHEEEDEDGWSLFYSSSTNMAVQVDETKTVGRDAFARIAPACAIIADIITAHNLFDALTVSSGRQLHFLIYDKYLRSLDKIIRGSKNIPGSIISNLNLAEGEIILDVEGTVATQPVLQHIGISAWPGRLTLTNYALYFESLGVGLYEKAARYDLAMDMKQIIKPELTGPLGARLFDKAVMYKSTSVAEPIYFEFPEFKGNSRRDYWLDICLEILQAHRFIRKHNFKETQLLEVLARASLGILRYRAVREAFRYFASSYKTLLPFKLAESLPRGDRILETLSSRLALVNANASPRDVDGSPHAKRQLTISPFALLTLSRLGFILTKESNLDSETVSFGDLCAGETNPLEIAVKQSISDTGKAVAAQATVDKVKVEGIDTNIAVMKELLFPIIELANRLQALASWEDPFKSIAFLVLSCFSILSDITAMNHLAKLRTRQLLFHLAGDATIYCDVIGLPSILPRCAHCHCARSGISKGWTRYILPSIFVWCAILMFIRRHLNNGKPLEAFRVTAPPYKNAVEQLLTLQEAVTQVEALIQSVNIILLKIRALMFAVLPQATERVALLLVFMAVLVIFVPVRHLILLIFLEAFTREMPYRKESSERWLRRFREWWVRIPAAPVQLIKVEDSKKKK